MSKAMSVSEAGRKGGNARAKKLTKERRIEIARQGYHASPLSVKHAKSDPNEQSLQKIVVNNPCA